jgi:hypothetical protein
MYKKALSLKIRFQTTKGLLTIEDLFDLNMSQLSNVIRNLKTKINKITKDDDELAFLGNTESKVDEELTLQYEIAKDIYLDKKSEKEKLKGAKEEKVRKEKIMGLIAEKEDQELKDLSVEELRKML